MGRLYQRGRLGILLAGLCSVLAFARSDSGESVWVFWAVDETGRAWASTEPESRAYAPPIAYPTRAACEARLEADARKYESGTDLRPQVIRSSGSTTTEYGATWVWMSRRYCLPDTVDPREPKGTK